MKLVSILATILLLQWAKGNNGVSLVTCHDCRNGETNSQQEAAARELKANADFLRALWKGVSCESEQVAGTHLQVMLAAAVVANHCPGRTDTINLAQRWLLWWDLTQPPTPFDIRTNAERFLEYVLRRMYGTIGEAHNIKLFENIERQLVNSYQTRKRA